jgi:hypothetical protein
MTNKKMWMAAMFALAALAAPGSAAAEGICTSFAKAKQADIKAPEVQRALKVWERMSRPFNAMTGRTTGIVVLAEEAGFVKGDGVKAYPPTGHICPGAPPVVYVTWPLVDLLYKQQRYPESFLAFVIGHELGHRFNDLDATGSLLGAAERPGKGRHEESLADKRAAFFATLAGYPMAPLARADIVSLFLSGEIGLRQGVVDERKAALMEALSTFDAYEDLYQVSLMLGFSAEDDAAERLLERVDELITADGVPLPELKALRAITLIQHAAPMAPWGKELSAKIDVSRLRCDPVFPMHTALREEPEDGALRGGGDEAAWAQAAARLRLASKLLDDAEGFGIAPIILHSARACLAFYEGDRQQMARHAEFTRKLVSDETPQLVREAIAANDAVMALGGMLASEPPPAQSEVGKAKAWGKKMGKAAGDKRYKASAEAARLLKGLASYPRQPAEALTTTAQPACKGKLSADEPRAASMPPTPEGARLGVCPAGWTALHTLPDAAKARAAGTTLGVTTCVPAQPLDKTSDSGSQKLVFIDLPGAMSPALPALKIKVFIEDMPEAERLPLASWSCGCGMMAPQGVSDTGEQVLLAVCPSRGLPLGVVLRDAQGRVARIAQVEAAEAE